MITFADFCQKYRLRMKPDVDGTCIVPGKLGHIYEYARGEFAVMLTLKSPRAFGFAHKRLLAASCTMRQRGDMEGSASFSPENRQGVTQAIREAKIARIPRRTAVQLATLRERGSRFRFQAGHADQGPPLGPCGRRSARQDTLRLNATAAQLKVPENVTLKIADVPKTI